MDVTSQIIYTELDIIFDTRLTLLQWLDPHLAKHSLLTGYYQNRPKDQFFYLGTKLFRGLYNRRDKEILQQPKDTYLIDYINKLCSEYKINDTEQGGNGIVELYINTYPYELTKSELEILKEGLSLKFRSANEINFCNIKSVTPAWIRDNDVVTMFMYYGVEWVNENLARDLLPKLPISEVMLLVPKLIKDGKLKKESEDTWKLMEDFSAPFINLQFIDVNYFNIVME